MNLDYKKVWKAYNNIPWYLKNDVFGFGSSLYLSHWQTRFNNCLEKTFKKKFPRRKKIDLSALGEEVIDEIREKYQEYFKNNYAQRVRQMKILESLLYSLAPTVEIPLDGETLYKIKVSKTSTYNSQGWGATRYAEKALDYDKSMLEKPGYKVEIRKVPEFAGDSDTSCKYMEFQLWANIEDWQFDCINRKTKFSQLEWAKDCWKRNINPAVLNPFLSEEIYHKSMEEYRC